MSQPLSPIDGRYRKTTSVLREAMSEQGLFSARIEVECRYLQALAAHDDIPVRTMTEEENVILDDLYPIDDEGYEQIKKIEATTNHDVKAVEYYIKAAVADTSIQDLTEWIHFGLTSEDINNLAYSLMLKRAVDTTLIPVIRELVDTVDGLAQEYRSVAMLARTHGQPATPTTVGKEFFVYVHRLGRQLASLEQFVFLGKFSGATGGYNAQVTAVPDVDWIGFARVFVESLGLEHNQWTTQIEPHDSWAELFHLLIRINTIVIDFDIDMWRYISDGWMIQKVVADEVGSSAMPHKVNPIQFENSEGNLTVANALLECFARVLPTSRLQRDLTDSTIERNFAPAFAHCLLGYQSCLSGISRMAVDRAAVAAALDNHPEVLAEAIQAVLRVRGYEAPYELLKKWTRGKSASLESLHELITTLDVDDATKQQLLDLRPSGYIGLSDQF